MCCAHLSAKGVCRRRTALDSLKAVAGFSTPTTCGVLLRSCADVMKGRSSPGKGVASSPEACRVRITHRHFCASPQGLPQENLLQVCQSAALQDKLHACAWQACTEDSSAVQKD